MTHVQPHEAAEGDPVQHAGGPGYEPLSELAHPTHKSDHDPAHHNDPEHVMKEVRKYWIVFGALAAFTIITVGISYLHLPVWAAVTLALIVASIKASMVAAVFMHLISEKKVIYAVLVLTVFFFGVMIWGPWHHRHDAEREWPGYDESHKKPAASTEQHGSGH